MLKSSLISLGLFAAAAASAKAPENMARIFTSDSFATYYAQDRQDLALNGQCNRLKGDQYHNVGSISIPCQQFAPQGKKYACTLYLDTACKNSIVTFDHSHYRLFDYGDGDRNSAVGGNVGSIKCESLDASTAISNDNGTPSTKHRSSCPGESCSSDSDCDRDPESPFYCAKSKSNTCQRAHILPEGAKCHDNVQCLKGYCAGPRDVFFQCKTKKAFLDRCDSTGECANGLKCCSDPWDDGLTYCNTSCQGSENKCTAVGLACWSNSACCSKNCKFDPNTIFSGECQ